MYSTRVLELIQIFVLYSITIFGLGDLISRPFTRGKGICYRILVDLTVGNFYIINMTFLLAFLKILKQPVIIAVFLITACLIRYLLDRKNVTAYWKQKVDVASRILRGEYGRRFAIWNGCRSLKHKIVKKCKNLGKERWLELLLLIIALCINVFYSSYQALNYVSYASPDVEVHLYWIQSLVGGNLFPAGVYPFGMHCVGAVLSLVYDVSAVTVARMMGVVATFYIMLVCYIFVKSICRQRYTPIFGFLLFMIVDFMVGTTYIRYSAMISQEYAMIFLCPLMIFLYRYLNHKKMQDLVFFGLATSLTLAIHFYITAVACFFFLVIGVVYFVRMIKRKMLGPIIVCGISSIVAALLPLIIGLAMGYEPEQSFAYGYAVLTNDYTNYADEDEYEAIEEIDALYGFLVEEPYTWDNIVETARGHLQTYAFSNIKYIWLFIIPIVLIIINWMLRLIVKKNTDRTMEYLATALYTLIVFVELVVPIFDLPIIIEPKRMAIFLAYMIPAMLAIPLELFYEVLPKKDRVKQGYNAAVLLLLVGGLAYTLKNGNERPLPQVYYFQTTGAMNVACDIINNYEEYTWTIVSPVNETSLVYNQGYHYEMLEFLKTLEDYEEGMEIFIPTEYVFFYVEKMPIELYGYAFDVTDSILTEREPISLEAAISPIDSYQSSPDDYYKYERVKLMSRMYYWAQAYMEYFPDEMSVFYEDDEMIVYRLKQNAYALNNLAIDYRGGLLNER